MNSTNGSPRMVSRRSFIGGGLALSATAALGLAGCVPAPKGASGGSGAGVKANAMPTAGAKAVKGTGTLDFVGFEGDDLPEILKSFFAENDITVNPNYQSGEPETLARLAGQGARGTDLTSWTSPYSTQFAAADVLLPIDPQKVPNLAKLWPFFVEDDRGWLTNAQGELIGIPQYWGGIGLVWDTEVLPKMKSWSDILDPALTGRVAMIDFPESIMQAASLAVGGVDPSKMTKDDLDKLVDWLTPVVKQVKVFSPSFGDIITLMGSHDVAAVFPGFPFLANSAAEAGATTFTASDRLEEGAIGAIEIVGIPRGADNPDAAYAFINQMLEPKINAEIAELQGSPGTVTGVAPHVSKAHRKAFAYDDLDGFYRSLGFFSAIPRTSAKYVTQDDVFAAWARLKSSAR